MPSYRKHVVPRYTVHPHTSHALMYLFSYPYYDLLYSVKLNVAMDVHFGVHVVMIANRAFVADVPLSQIVAIILEVSVVDDSNGLHALKLFLQ